MARIKISKVAKDLNVALPTVVEFLRGKNITVDDNPNARIEEEVVSLLVNAFKSDKDQKSLAKSRKFRSKRNLTSPASSAQSSLTSMGTRYANLHP